jgi:hypothetical protein
MQPWGVVEKIEDLIDHIEGMGLGKGTKKNLVAKLTEAIHLYNKGNYVGSAHKLADFIDYTNAQVGKKLTQAQADEIVAVAQWIIYIITA